jgi:catechol 2,3-dioxygenase-like lactoylglutathione lyase family enzyme
MDTCPGLAGYHHLGLTVRDVEASEAWYAEVLGLGRAFVEKHDNGTGYAVVMTPPDTSFFLGLDHHDEADRQVFDARRTGLDHLAFAVSSSEEVHAWAARFAALGVDHDPVKESDDPMPLAMVTARDPDGIALELIWTVA